LAYRLAYADKIAEPPAFFDSRGETLGSSSHLELTLRVIEESLQLRKVGQWLRKKVSRALLDRFDCDIDTSLRRDQKDGAMRITRFQCSQQFEAGNFRHYEIADNDVGVLFFDKIHSLGCIRCLQGFEPPVLQKYTER